MSAQSDHAREALEQVCARGNLQRAHELYAEDFIDHVNTLDFHGHDGIARSVALYRALFPDLEIRVLDQSTDGDRVTSRWTLHGTHKGRAVTLPGITISRFAHGKIAEDWTVSDNLELLRRLGARRGLALAARSAPPIRRVVMHLAPTPCVPPPSMRPLTTPCCHSGNRDGSVS